MKFNHDLDGRNHCSMRYVLGVRSLVLSNVIIPSELNGIDNVSLWKSTVSFHGCYTQVDANYHNPVERNLAKLDALSSLIRAKLSFHFKFYLKILSEFFQTNFFPQFPELSIYRENIIERIIIFNKFAKRENNST